MTSPNELLLPGLDGSNPLAFLAALGTWRITDKCYPGTRMRWTSHGGHWSPVLSFPKQKPEDFVERLHERLQEMHDHEVFTFTQNLKLKPIEFKHQACKAVERFHEESDPISVTFLAAFGSEVTVNEQCDIQDTAFRTMSGAGHQHFIKTMNDVARLTSLQQIDDTLFNVWSYREEKAGFRWDPSEDKRYALAWQNPSQDTTMTQRGANRLAVEALPLFPTAPMGEHLETTGFRGHRSHDTFWSWPLWDASINIETVRSILALREVTEEEPDAETLNGRGIVAVFRSQRITTGKFRNFTPAVQVA